MNRVENKLLYLKEKKEKAFITYMTAGLPDMEGTKAIIKAQAESGVDIVELGIPFSDPIADGPVIQAASYESLLKGTNLTSIFQAVEEIRRECEIPIVFMLYYNTILYYGVNRFVQECIRTGVDGLIVPDLPFEEQGELKECLSQSDETILIQLVAPVSKQRIPMILSEARGFVYCVSSMGVTGQDGNFHRDVVNYLKEVKEISSIPVMMGFGIKHPSDILPMRDIIDGAIVGSHFIKLMKEQEYSIDKIKEFCVNFKRTLNFNEIL